MIFSTLTFRRLRLRLWEWKRTLAAVILYDPSRQIAPQFPHVDWTFRDDEMAQKEGWNLYENNGYMHIECSDECAKGKPPFSCTQDAIAHVDRQARSGSKLHQRALNVHHNHRRLAQAVDLSPYWPPHSITDEVLRGLNPHLDPTDFGILRDRAGQFNHRHEPTIGDVVRFWPAHRNALQISQLIPSAQEVQLFHIQPVDLDPDADGFWSDGPTIARHLLTDTGNTDVVDVRFWHHDLYQTELVTARVPCKVWLASPGDLHFPSLSE